MKHINVQGYNGDIDVGTEDLIPDGGTRSLPAAAAATNVVSSSTDDDGDPVGTGARTIRVHGLDANFDEIVEDVTLNGTTQVVLTNEFYRVNLVEVLTAGSGLAAAGTISVRHNTTAIAVIEVGQNRSRSAIYTPSNQMKSCVIKTLYGSITNGVAGAINFALQTRKPGGLWQTRFNFGMYGTAYPALPIKLGSHIYVEPGEDIKLIGTASAANSAVAGGFDLIASTRPILG